MDEKQTQLENLVARVAKLESQNRRWKLAAVLLGICATPLILIGAKPAQRSEPTVFRARSVEAEQFVLKGEDGHVYARLVLDPDLQRISGDALGPMTPAAMEFYDVNGRVAVVLPTPPKVTPLR